MNRLNFPPTATVRSMPWLDALFLIFFFFEHQTDCFRILTQANEINDEIDQS